MRRTAERGMRRRPAKRERGETRELLARGYIREGWTVTEVAFTLGFADASSFSRAFRRWTGLAPTEFAVP